jgi:hypothetical protein
MARQVGAGGAGGAIGTGGVSESALLAGCALVMHMNETSWSGSAGDVVDSCGQNNGTAVMGLGAGDALPTTTSAGYFGGAGLFDNRNGCVEVADGPSLRPTSQLTLSAWIYPTALDPGSNGVIAKRIDYMNSSSYTMFLWAADGLTYQLWADIGADRFHGNQAFVVNDWYHVAVVFDGSLPTSQRVRLYVNGALDGELSDTAGTIPNFPSPLYVGCLPLSGPAQEFAGKVDEVAVWTRALGSDEILQLYLAKVSL